MVGNTGIIVQARLTGKRFPNKMLHPINNKPVILHTLERLEPLGIPIVVAIPHQTSNGGLKWFLQDRGYNVFEGPEEDVLHRFVLCAEHYELNPIIRICGDSPIISRAEVIRTIKKYNEFGQNWLAVGLGVQIISFKALKWADTHCCRIDMREHVWTTLEGSINYPEDINRVEDYINGKQ